MKSPSRGYAARSYVAAWGAGVLLLLRTPVLAAPTIGANPNPVVVPPGQSSGTTTLSWNGEAAHPFAEVWVQVDNADETFVVEQGKGSREVKVEVGKTYIYKLSDAGKTLASVTVTAQSQAGNTGAANLSTPSGGDWAGNWETTSDLHQFALTLQQDGNKVSGTYTPNNGRIEGTAQGNILRFKWTSDGGAGSGRFLMGNGEMAFSGTYSNNDNPDNADGIWIGTRKMSGGGGKKTVSFAGTWVAIYKIGNVISTLTYELQQSGKIASGYYYMGSDDKNRINLLGKVEGNTFSYGAFRPGSTDAVDSGQFVMAADGKSITGKSKSGKSTTTANRF